jgi:hypothetical protein
MKLSVPRLHQKSFKFEMQVTLFSKKKNGSQKVKSLKLTQRALSNIEKPRTKKT